MNWSKKWAVVMAFLSAFALAGGVPIQSGTSGNLADVDSAGRLLVRDTGIDGGVPTLSDFRGNLIELGDDGRFDITQDQILFRDVFQGSAISAHNKWLQSITTMTATVGSGALTLNASAITTVSTYANLTTPMKFRGGIDGALFVSARARPINLPQTNAEAILGFANMLTNATPTDGLFFRWTASGGFECVLNRGGTETSTNMTAPTANVYSVFSAWVKGDQFFCMYETPSTGAKVEVTTNIDSSAPGAFVESPGVGLRVANSAVAPALAPQLVVGLVVAGTKVYPRNTGPDELSQWMGQGGAFVPTTGAQNTTFANSAASASATLSNVAAGYATMGGIWQFAAPAGAETDYALFAVQNPTSFRFVVTGVHISTCNMVVASATTPTMFQWGLGLGSTAVSLATADATGAAPTSAPRRLALGVQSMPVGTAVGACITDLDIAPGTPLGAVESGRFLHLILRIPVGTATATEVYRGTALIRGYYEQ